MSKLVSTLIFSAFASGAWAEAPRVVADIVPVHSLAAQVMKGVGEPSLLIEPTASPHSYALRPSQAGSLEKADVVLLTSSALTPWLVPSLEKLATKAKRVELMELEGIVKLASRGKHDHGDDDDDNHDDHEGHDDHTDDKDHDSHDDHDDHDDDEEGHDDHTGGDDHDAHDDHNHEAGAFDPHGWLSIENAQIWVRAISATLIEADPENAARYRENTVAALASLEAMSADIDAKMSPVKTQHYMGLHDAFQYFDQRFGPEFAGSIKLGDATDPSPARVAHARDEMEEHNVRCIFREPQQSDKLVHVVIEGGDAKIGQLDAIGATLTPGPNLYSELLHGIADSFADCLAD